MSRPRLFSVPEAIATELNLTELRTHDGAGRVLLSGRDLAIDGIDKALDEGAEELSPDEAKEIFHI